METQKTPPQCYGLVYCATNMINGKKYIGQTTQKLKSRIFQHNRSAKYKSEKGKCRAILSAIRKYGEESFKWEVLRYCDDQDSLNAAEKELIKEHKTCDPKHGYNLREGGGGGKYSDAARKRFSKLQMGRKHSEETRKKLSEAALLRYAQNPVHPNLLNSRRRQSIPILVIKDNKSTYYESVEHAARAIGCNSSNVRNAAKRNGTCKGYAFKLLMEKQECTTSSRQQSFLPRAPTQLSAILFYCLRLILRLLVALLKPLLGRLGVMSTRAQRIVVTATALPRLLAYFVRSIFTLPAKLFRGQSKKTGKSIARQKETIKTTRRRGINS